MVLVTRNFDRVAHKFVGVAKQNGQGHVLTLDWPKRRQFFRDIRRSRRHNSGVPFPMAARALTAANVPKTYAELRDAVRSVVLKGRQEIDRAWLVTYHETGRLINEHVLLFKERADYGARTYLRLADDTGISKRTLQECAQFHRYFPIARTCAQLGWAQCRLLCQVSDDKQRTTLLTQATRHQWTAVELQSRVRAVNAIALESGESKADEPVELLVPRRGTPGLHPIVDRGDGPVVDLGFKLYRELSPSSRLGVGDIVRLNDDGVRRVDGATKAELFTYAATIRRVIDGDTFAVALAVAPGITLELKLRLRGLDCPEISTAAGRAAKRFVDGLVRAGDEVIVSTTKPDKYDRYLADVFIGQLKGESMKLKAGVKDQSPTGSDLQLSTFNSQPEAEGTVVFLNNALLEAGHAVRYDGEGPKE